MRSRSLARPLLCAGLAVGIAAASAVPAAIAETPTGAAPTVQGQQAQNYLVLYRSGGKAAGASLSAIQASGGSVVADYSAIGVAVVSSSASNFPAKLRAADASVDAASATASFGVALKDDAADGPADQTVPASLAPGDDPLSGLQWDMTQIHAPEARAISGGSPSVVVGDIDTGLDWSHPDLAPNVDFAKSASCIGGVPNQDPAAWMDDYGHGTHTAGTIAAAKNGLGIVGVAPNVKLAGIKAGDASGFFFPEAVVCAFMWAADHGIAVTNNSYFGDPWLFNCKNDPQQRAIWEAERRAIRYAQSKGTLVVAAANNQADDLAHPTQDATSPDTTAPVVRDITNACAVVPAEVPGVVTVSAVGNLGLKSFFSSYGIGVVDVTAPGGDSVLQRTAAAPNGRVLSTWPASIGCSRAVYDSGAKYCYLQGTSMATPHVAGLAALLASTGANSGQIASRIANTADPIACPADVSIYSFFPALDGGTPQACTGGRAYNSFYGHGQINALRAIGG
ncbi:peptidase S8 [Sinomonas cellulolyticus]|uniref:S8 family serine peptidase n=1 Tax=Sinomonas cellulolyticus TaxID=2801916 RepID=A0ABS1K761_9MICC|nr:MULTISPECIES: S8 family serine peptidase [Sinomonas]MBL0707298.1 S8 family serine peptidase [Sinomonas cellulolyticus]GHG50514.1 peptidase S8 [Sinomonas sp. KCTC 49339]